MVYALSDLTSFVRHCVCKILPYFHTYSYRSITPIATVIHCVHLSQFFFLSTFDGHMGSLQLVTITANAALNMSFGESMHPFLRGVFPAVEWLVRVYPTLDAAKQFSAVVALIYTPINSTGELWPLSFCCHIIPPYLLTLGCFQLPPLWLSESALTGFHLKKAILWGCLPFPVSSIYFL